MFEAEKMKNYLWTSLNFLMAVLILVGLFSLIAIWKYQATLLPARTLNISAEGKTTVSPDLASFSFAVVSEGQDPEVLAAENNKKMNEAIDFVKKQGIDSKDIKTANYNLYPRYEYDEKHRTSFITGYTLNQTVFVKIRDFTKIGKIMGGLPEFGINEIGSLNFEVENPDKYLNVAREEAFSKALAKAKEMAKQNGVRIKGVVTFSESSGGYPIMFREAYGLGGGAKAVAVPAPQIEPGSQEVTVNVTVTYEIR